jgi:putative transposase
VLAATNFFTVEVWTGRGLVRYRVLFVIQLATRAVKIAGLVPGPTESWMLQIARNLVDPWTGFLTSSRLLIHDRATVISEHFRQLLRSGQVEPLRLPARSANLNAHAERFVRTIRHECLGRMVFFGESSLRRVVAEFVTHYNQERNHQGLANQLIRPTATLFPAEGALCRRKRLGGLINYYYREAT